MEITEFNRENTGINESIVQNVRNPESYKFPAASEGYCVGVLVLQVLLYYDWVQFQIKVALEERIEEIAVDDQ